MLAFKYVSERFNFWTRPKIKGPHSVVVKVNMMSYLRLVLFKTLIREVLERFFLIASLFFKKQYWNWNTYHSANPWKIKVKNYWRQKSQVRFWSPIWDFITWDKETKSKAVVEHFHVSLGDPDFQRKLELQDVEEDSDQEGQDNGDGWTQWRRGEHRSWASIISGRFWV